MVPEARQRLSLLLDWPEVQEEHKKRISDAERAEREAAQTQGSEQLVASFGTSIDKMYERAIRARTLAQAQIAETQRQAKAKENRGEG